MEGWECPQCHRCYAPSVTMCNFCPPEVVTSGSITLGTVVTVCEKHEWDEARTVPACKYCGAVKPFVHPFTGVVWAG